MMDILAGFLDVCATYNFIIIGVVYVQLQTPSSGDCIHQCS